MPTGRAFPIRRQDVKSYTALTPNGSSSGRRLVARPLAYRPNAGVSHIAAVNGRGAYARAHEPSAREAAGLRRNAGSIRLSGSHEGEVPMIRLRKNRVKSAATPNKKKRRKSKAKRNGSYSMAVVRKARKSLRRKSPSTRKRLRKAASTRAAKRKATPNKKRRTVKRRRSLKRNSAAAVTPNKKRRVKRRSPKRRVKARLTANKKRRTVKRRRSLKRNRLTTNRKRRSSRRLKSNRKRRTVRRNRSTRRATPNRKRRSVRRSSRRRSLRRNSARRASPNRKRRSMRRNSRRRSMRRNGSQLMAFFKEAAITGLLVAGGFFAHKLLTNLLEENLMRGLFEKKPEQAAGTQSEGAPAKKSALKDYSKLISGAVVAVAGVAATGYLVKDKSMALKLSAGMVTSFIQQAVLTYLVESENAAGIQYLSGLDDGSAARLSSMAGDINRTTIQPFYTRLGEFFPHGTSGYGEYFANPAMGEYFQNPAMSGFGALEAAAGLGGGIYSAAAGYGDPATDEATAQLRKAAAAAYVMSGRNLYGSHPDLYKPMAGLNGYGSNPDIYQAVAGTRHHYIEGQHIDPTTSNLDRELSIMESMSGVGQVSSWNTELSPMQDGEGSSFRDGSLGGIYAASAGFGEFIEPGANGVQTVPTTQTWIPGESEGELWAGVRNVDANMSTADVPAGIMQTIGGSGIFG